MANLRDIKDRIQSIESTKKITRAMKMVAAAKVKKSETAVKAARPYTRELVHMFQKLLNSVTEFSADTLKIKHAIDDYPALLQKRDRDHPLLQGKCHDEAFPRQCEPDFLQRYAV